MCALLNLIATLPGTAGYSMKPKSLAFVSSNAKCVKISLHAITGKPRSNVSMHLPNIQRIKRQDGNPQARSIEPPTTSTVHYSWRTPCLLSASPPEEGLSVCPLAPHRGKQTSLRMLGLSRAAIQLLHQPRAPRDMPHATRHGEARGIHITSTCSCPIFPRLDWLHPELMSVLYDI